MRKLDLIGKKFGRLEVLEEGIKQKTHQKYICQCDCGNMCEVIGHKLSEGRTQSCGCLSAELARDRRQLPKGIASFNQLYSVYKNSAEKRNYDFNLNKDKFKELTTSNCFYCGQKPNSTAGNKSLNGLYTYNGIDRVDNLKGYILGNVVPCCQDCNRMKGQLSVNEFKEKINKILKNWVMRVK